MDKSINEILYPSFFRSIEAKSLQEKIDRRQSVELVGMKRVGINHFLRFFIFNKEAKAFYFSNPKQHLFILVDLNDLVERELSPFWRLTLKRIADTVASSMLPTEVKEKISQIFLRSIQISDTFYTYDSVRESLILLSKEVNPTIFLTRFDRLRETMTIELFNNFESLVDSTHGKLSFVFTSFKDFDEEYFPQFSETHFTNFASDIYIKPANTKDVNIMLDEFLKTYHLTLSPDFREFIIKASGGHAHCLQLLLIILDEEKNKDRHFSLGEFINATKKDERIALLLEELWESLGPIEQTILKKVTFQDKIGSDEKQDANYLWDTGMVQDKQNKSEIFSNLFADFVIKKETIKKGDKIDLTKKEHVLFELLKQNLNGVCERDMIVKEVWPEYKDFGVSDWTVDKLVARLRTKMKDQNQQFEIKTVRTRGYKLTSSK